MDPISPSQPDAGEPRSGAESLARRLGAVALVLVGGLIGVERGASYAWLDSQDWTGLPPTLGPMIAGVAFIGGGLLLGAIMTVPESTRPGGRAVVLFMLAVIVGSFAGVVFGPRIRV